MRPTPLSIPDVLLFDLERHGDDRGFFVETYRDSWFRDAGLPLEFVQDNHARSGRGVLRGLHYQLPPAGQGKLIRVARGRVFDVAVDVRADSPTLGRWVGVELSDERPQMLYIPPGFAHGYCVLSEVADFLYKVTAEYAPAWERGVRWDDPAIGIQWPLAQPTLSARDVALPGLAAAELFGGSGG
ncbi:MAG: dTDP-4-dehydrorhamnose 3,5-epimerase [Gemmatimonadota bacterium]